ncbi:MAG: hypothetical protein KIT72_12610 [Polyangiaceae bacterium]|nr:hypothetical protein [Polyangiaceae bacterium]MCW5791256.1 hypothetical protein [Polyangiaceae bacterium]
MVSQAPNLGVVAAPARPPVQFRREVGEFLLVGGATWLLFPICWLLERWLGMDAAIYQMSFIAFYAAFVINDPHFGVTYLLFYRDVKQRAFGSEYGLAQRIRYLVGGFVVPVVLLTWAALALTTPSVRAIGLMVQLMFLLVGWHYVKQGFGVLTVLSARRGFAFKPLERRVMLAHCYLGWGYAWASPFDPGSLFEEHGVVYRSLTHPTWLEPLMASLFAASTVALVGVLGKRLVQREGFPPLTPLIGFLVTVWLWTIFTSLDPLMAYLIPGLHSLQYLYFVWLLRRNKARATQRPLGSGMPVMVQLGLLALGALLIGWTMFRIGPMVLGEVMPALPKEGGGQVVDDGRRTLLGATPYAAVLLAMVNIHHYFMDHVIWRRENPETRFLRG